ncbi:MAG: class I SAM-dependent methyltransferase [Vicinamibacterales bacterium]
MNIRDHWNSIYNTKTDEEVSWFEPLPAVSLRLLAASGLNDDSCVIDVGGGNSRLVDFLVQRGLDCIAVLDVSGLAIESAKARIGAAAPALTWIEADIAGDWSLKPMDIWHDRAVFHFLTEPDQRARYRDRLISILKPGGAAIVATFAADGPERCSGLPVVRYSPESLAQELGRGLDLVESVHSPHHTPWGTTQWFQYSRFVRN